MQEFLGPSSAPHVRHFRDPGFDQSIMVVAFEGWNDAGEAASGTADHLIHDLSLETFGEIDCEEFFDFSETRPHVVLTKGGSRRILWPTTEFFAGTHKPSGRNLVVVRGIEPQLKWRTFCDQIISMATANGATMVVTLGALLADVPHSRPTIIYGSSDDTDLANRFEFKPSTYEGPTGIVGVLNSQFAGAGVPTVSLWAAVPTYVPGAASPKATLALTEKLNDVIGTGIDTRDLAEATADYERDVDSLVADDDETSAYVAELERNYDEGVEQTPELLVQEVEQFLREQNS